jgi:CRP/FNR family transcriptional regulator
MTDIPDPLADLPLVQLLTDDQRREVLASGSERTLAKGEILFHEADQAEALFAVISGNMKLVRYSPTGKEMLLHVVRSGESFAEAALFGRGTYPATAVAVERTRLWSLPRTRLLELIRRSPELGISMVASISVWTRKLAGKLELLTQRRVEERLAIYLLSRTGDTEIAPGHVIRLAEPKNLIAAQCGTAPEVLSRTFKRLEEDQILVVEKNNVRILNPGAFRELAEWIDD